MRALGSRGTRGVDDVWKPENRSSSAANSSETSAGAEGSPPQGDQKKLSLSQLHNNGFQLQLAKEDLGVFQDQLKALLLDMQDCAIQYKVYTSAEQSSYVWQVSYRQQTTFCVACLIVRPSSSNDKPREDSPLSMHESLIVAMHRTEGDHSLANVLWFMTVAKLNGTSYVPPGIDNPFPPIETRKLLPLILQQTKNKNPKVRYEMLQAVAELVTPNSKNACTEACELLLQEFQLSGDSILSVVFTMLKEDPTLSSEKYCCLYIILQLLEKKPELFLACISDMVADIWRALPVFVPEADMKCSDDNDVTSGEVGSLLKPFNMICSDIFASYHHLLLSAQIRWNLIRCENFPLASEELKCFTCLIKKWDTFAHNLESCRDSSSESKNASVEFEAMLHRRCLKDNMMARRHIHRKEQELFLIPLHNNGFRLQLAKEDLAIFQNQLITLLLDMQDCAAQYKVYTSAEQSSHAWQVSSRQQTTFCVICLIVRPSSSNDKPRKDSPLSMHESLIVAMHRTEGDHYLANALWFTIVAKLNGTSYVPPGIDNPFPPIETSKLLPLILQQTKNKNPKVRYEMLQAVADLVTPKSKNDCTEACELLLQEFQLSGDSILSVVFTMLKEDPTLSSEKYCCLYIILQLLEKKPELFLACISDMVADIWRALPVFVPEADMKCSDDDNDVTSGEVGSLLKPFNMICSDIFASYHHLLLSAQIRWNLLESRDSATLRSGDFMRHYRTCIEEWMLLSESLNESFDTPLFDPENINRKLTAGLNCRCLNYEIAAINNLHRQYSDMYF